MIAVSRQRMIAAACVAGRGPGRTELDTDQEGAIWRLTIILFLGVVDAAARPAAVAMTWCFVLLQWQRSWSIDPVLIIISGL